MLVDLFNPFVWVFVALLYCCSIAIPILLILILVLFVNDIVIYKGSVGEFYTKFKILINTLLVHILFAIIVFKVYLI